MRHGVQAIKGVEIGDGFLEAMRPGSQAHDEMVVGDDGRITRLSNRAGGIEGGMSNGQPIVVRAAMKPIPSIPKALRTVDVTTGEAASHQPAFRQHRRACGIRGGRGMVRLTLAKYALDKFGGDSVAETRRNLSRISPRGRSTCAERRAYGFVTTAAEPSATVLTNRREDS